MVNLTTTENGITYRNVRECIFRFHRTSDTLHLSLLSGKCNLNKLPTHWILRWDLSRPISAEMSTKLLTGYAMRHLISLGPTMHYGGDVTAPPNSFVSLSIRYQTANLATPPVDIESR